MIFQPFIHFGFSKPNNILLGMYGIRTATHIHKEESVRCLIECFLVTCRVAKVAESELFD